MFFCSFRLWPRWMYSLVIEPLCWLLTDWGKRISSLFLLYRYYTPFYKSEYEISRSDFRDYFSLTKTNTSSSGAKCQKTIIAMHNTWTKTTNKRANRQTNAAIAFSIQIHTRSRTHPRDYGLSLNEAQWVWGFLRLIATHTDSGLSLSELQ